MKTVKSIGSDVLIAMWRAMTAGIEVPVSLHLDHCPDRAVITECLDKGWNSVLFDASTMPVEENLRQTIEVVAEARAHGAHVEGEIEAIKGVEDDIGTDEVSKRQTLEVSVNFVETSGVDVFAPSIGNAHGVYSATPDLDGQRVTDIVAATGVPIALHGGTRPDRRAVHRPDRPRLREGQHVHRAQGHLHEVEPGVPARRRRARDSGTRRRCSGTSRADVTALAAGYVDRFGSAGRAW